MKGTFMANASKQPFKIQDGVIMGGYSNRNDTSIGTNDELYTKALTIFNGEKTVIIITNDLLGVDEEIIESVTCGIKKEIDISTKDIFICATHTHSGPDIIKWNIEKDVSNYKLQRTVKKEIIKTIIENALKSTKNLQPVKLNYGSSKCNKVTSNRIDEKLPMDDTVNVISLKEDNGEPISIILNYACHPTVLGADNLKISADYPGVVQKLVEQHYDNKCICMFINGACGNQSTRFTRKAQDFEEVKRIGEILYSSVLIALSNLKEIKDIKIKSIKEYLQFPKKKLPDYSEIKKQYEQIKHKKESSEKDSNISAQEKRIIITKYQGVCMALKLLEKIDDLDLTAPIQLLRIGDVVLVGVPVELFCEYGLEIKAKSYFNNTIVAAYTNGMLGYVYTPESYDNKDYEAWSSPFNRESGKFIVENVLRLMNKLKD